jgi:procollagen-lysine,2-oxoglutarate 5-dioxygenase
MFISNEMNYGHLIDPENFNISLTQPELYEVFNNIKVNYFERLLDENKSVFFKDWKARYLHPDYHKSLEPNATIEQVHTNSILNF